MSETKSVFQTLSAINVNDHTEKKNGLTYLSWAWAWAEVKKRYPDATYKVFKDSFNRPYIFDPVLGYMCFTEVTIQGETLEMWLPVMDGANKAMKDTDYTYQVAEWINRRRTGKMIDKSVVAATMFDINTAIMRCLVKNLAMFGLGHYIYAGEDIPEEQEKATATPIAPTKKVYSKEDIAKLVEGLNAIKTKAALSKYWNADPEAQAIPDFKNAVILKKAELEAKESNKK